MPFALCPLRCVQVNQCPKRLISHWRPPWIRPVGTAAALFWSLSSVVHSGKVPDSPADHHDVPDEDSDTQRLQPTTRLLLSNSISISQLFLTKRLRYHIPLSIASLPTSCNSYGTHSLISFQRQQLYNGTADTLSGIFSPLIGAI